MTDIEPTPQRMTAQELIDWRERMGWSVLKATRITGLSRTAWTSWEAGRITPPRSLHWTLRGVETACN